MILGDNIFYGSNFINKYLINQIKNPGSTIYLYSVSDPSRFGIAELDNNKNLKKISEKPKNSQSNLAITGLYFFDKNVSEYSKDLKPSKEEKLK